MPRRREGPGTPSNRPSLGTATAIAVALLVTAAGSGADRHPAAERGSLDRSLPLRLAADRIGGRTLARGPDFNGDGFADLAVGAPLEDLSGKADAGGVNVLYGSAAGVTATDDRFWSQDSSGILGSAELNDQFGTSAAAGDFDGDGFADLAVGAPFDDVGAIRFAGAVNVLYGSPSGLASNGNQLWTEDSEGILDESEPNDLFGFAVATGDVDGDGFDELAIGNPYEKVGSATDAGTVSVVRGSPAGLTADRNQRWTQDSSGIANEAEPDDGFGNAVTFGDVNGDGLADLVATVPFEDLGPAADAGGFHVLLGSRQGLTSSGAHFWTQDSNGILDGAQSDDLFGWSATSADFDGDGFSDVTVGVESETVGSVADAGAVHVLYGSPSALTADGDQFLTQNSSGVPDSAETQDFFGGAVAAGDFDGDGIVDLAAGAHREDLGGFTDAGGVIALYGSPTGLTGSGSQLWHQDSSGIKDKDESYDLFGYSLASAHYGNGSEADLAIGVVLEDVSSTPDAGTVNLVFGSPSGLASADNQYWNQGITGVEERAEVGDEFGFDIATGR